MDFLMGIPEMAEALSGDDIESTAVRIAWMFEAIRTVRGMNDAPQPPLPPAE